MTSSGKDGGGRSTRDQRRASVTFGQKREGFTIKRECRQVGEEEGDNAEKTQEGIKGGVVC